MLASAIALVVSFALAFLMFGPFDVAIRRAARRGKPWFGPRAPPGFGISPLGMEGMLVTCGWVLGLMLQAWLFIPDLPTPSDALAHWPDVALMVLWTLLFAWVITLKFDN